MPSSRQQEAMPINRDNARSTGSRTPTKDKRLKTVGGILGFKQQNTGKVKFKGSKKKSNERKYKKNKKKQKITSNSGTKSEEETQKKTHTLTGKNQLKKEQDSEMKLEEETQKKTHTLTGKNQLKKEQDSEMKSEEDTQKNTHTVTGKNQLKKEQDSDKTILHNDNNFGTNLVPNQPDGILKQVQKTSSENSTQQKETITNNTTEQFKETETCDQVTIGGDKTGERKVQRNKRPIRQSDIECTSSKHFRPSEKLEAERNT